MASFTPRPLLPPSKSPGTHCIRGWVGPRASLEGFGKSNPCTHWHRLIPYNNNIKKVTCWYLVVRNYDNNYNMKLFNSWDSSVGVETSLWVRLVTRCGWNFSFFIVSIQGLKSAQPCIHGVTEALCQMVKRPQLWADRLPPSSADISSARGCTLTCLPIMLLNSTHKWII